jgi:hypothetical protein
VVRLNAERVRRAVQARVPAHTRTVEELTARVAVLEEEVRECRRQQLRLAELTDVVQELLLPLSQRDQEKVDELLERYTSQLG